MKFQTKLIIAFCSIILLMGISQSIYLNWKLQSTFKDYIEQQNSGYMDRLVENLEIYYAKTGSWENVQQLFSNLHHSFGHGNGMMMRGMGMNSNSLHVFLLDENKIILADSTGEQIGTKGNHLTGTEKDVIIDGLKKGTLLFLPYKLQELERGFLHSAQMSIWISVLITAAISVFISYWMAKTISSPLKKLMSSIKRLSKGEQNYEVQITTNDEFRELGDEFNIMAKKLVRNEHNRKTLVADVAHELRTPLTILQGKLESILDGVTSPNEEVIVELTDEVYRLNRLVSDLQQLSLAESGNLSLNKQHINIKELAQKICRQFEWLAHEKEIHLQYDDMPNNCNLFLDPDRMTQVLVNLIGNALRYTPEKGRVEVKGEEKENSFILNVFNTGPAIPKEQLPFIFDRFYKVDSSRTRQGGGSGLGLSIAKGFVEAHHGTIAVDSDCNTGTVITVTLPKHLGKNKKDEVQ